MPVKLMAVLTGWLLVPAAIMPAAEPVAPAADGVAADKTQSYTLTTVAAVPADAAAWAKLPAATLVQGDPKQTPDLVTRVRLALHGENLFVRFEAEEPSTPMVVDRLAVFVKGADLQPLFHVNGEGAFPNKLPQKLAGYTYKDGVWVVMLKCRAAALGIEPGQAKTVEVQFERKRGARGKAPAVHYHWIATPSQSAEQPRFGRLEAGPSLVEDPDGVRK